MLVATMLQLVELMLYYSRSKLSIPDEMKRTITVLVVLDVQEIGTSIVIVTKESDA
jgi:hypothetical protein